MVTLQGDPACFAVEPHGSWAPADVRQRPEVPKLLKGALSYDEFCNRFMSHNLPVIIQGVADEWNITQHWVSEDGHPCMEAICQVASTSEVFVTDTRRELKGAGQCVTMTVKDYCRWWADHKAGIGSAAGQLLYLKDWHFLHEHPEFQAYQLPEYFSDDWLNEYYDHCGSQRGSTETGMPMDTDESSTAQASAVTSDYRFVYLGPQGSTTPLHADVLRSFSWSANIAGRKRWRLLPPEHSWLLYDTTLTQLAPDFYLEGLPDVCPADYPGLAAAQELLIEVIQEPGEAIFVPACWHHTVENLVDTLSLNHNWLNAFSAPATWAFLRRQRDLAEASISDCRALCSSEEEFQELVQKLLASNAGLGLHAWVDLLGFVVARERGRLCAAAGTLEGVSGVGPRQSRDGRDTANDPECNARMMAVPESGGVPEAAAAPEGMGSCRRRVLASLQTCGGLLRELLQDESARSAARGAVGSRGRTRSRGLANSSLDGLASQEPGSNGGSGNSCGSRQMQNSVAEHANGAARGQDCWQPGYVALAAALLQQVQATLQAAQQPDDHIAHITHT